MCLGWFDWENLGKRTWKIKTVHPEGRSYLQSLPPSKCHPYSHRQPSVPATPSFSCDNRVCFSLQWAWGYTYRQLGERSVRSLGFLRMSHFFKNNKTSRHHLISACSPGSCNLFCNCIPSFSGLMTRPPSQRGPADRQRSPTQDRQGLVQKICRFQMMGGKCLEALEGSG